LTPLGARHHEVRRLRALLRERAARAEDDAFVLEGPRVVTGALARGARIDTLYLGPGADRAFASLVERARDAGARVEELREGVLEKIGTTRTPQPVFAVTRRRVVALGSLPAVGHLVVTVDVTDPGNLGTIMRSAEASGADGLVVAGESSVDVHHPKVVRASAGAIFGLDIAEQPDPADALAALARRDGPRLAARVADSVPYDEADLTRVCTLVVGNEARGLPGELDPHLDGSIGIPMAGDANSLNVAMAATILCFEAARQRRAALVR
jgi:TrmH family RNA methyltransferase